MDYNPILSLATAALEIGAAVWALRGPGRRSIVIPASAILLLLAAYQVVEAVICTASFTATSIFSFLPRLAFIVVAWLPPTGLWLTAKLYPGKKRPLQAYATAMYLVGAGLVLAIATDVRFVSATVCEIVFARFTNPTPLYRAYGLFYQSGLFAMLLISAYGVTIASDTRQRLLLGQVLLGSIAFIFPSLVTVAVVPVAERALPSIMCHFALLLALFLFRLLWIERRESVPVLDEALSGSLPAGHAG